MGRSCFVYYIIAMDSKSTYCCVDLDVKVYIYVECMIIIDDEIWTGERVEKTGVLWLGFVATVVVFIGDYDQTASISFSTNSPLWETW